MRDISFKEGNIKFDYRVSAIIECNGKYLFQIMDHDKNLTLVGGRATLMKTSKQSMIRELKEELGYEAKEEDLKLCEIAENFFDYYDDKNELHQVHSILFIHKLHIPSNVDIASKNGFSVLDKEKTKLIWITKEEAEKTSILPTIAKRLLDSSEFSYDIIDDTKEGVTNDLQ